MFSRKKQKKLEEENKIKEIEEDIERIRQDWAAWKYATRYVIYREPPFIDEQEPHN